MARLYFRSRELERANPYAGAGGGGGKGKLAGGVVARACFGGKGKRKDTDVGGKGDADPAVVVGKGKRMGMDVGGKGDADTGDGGGKGEGKGGDDESHSSASGQEGEFFSAERLRIIKSCLVFAKHSMDMMWDKMRFGEGDGHDAGPG